MSMSRMAENPSSRVAENRPGEACKGRKRLWPMRGGGLLLLLGAAILDLGLASRTALAMNVAPISADGFGNAWPFTVSAGTLVCEQKMRGGRVLPMVTFIPVEGPYAHTPLAVNGTAATDYPDVDPIWRNDERTMKELAAAGVKFAPDGWRPKVQIGPIIEAGLKLCE